MGSSKAFSWMAVAIALSQFPVTCGVHRTHAHIRLMTAISRIKIVDLLAILNDLLN